MRENLQNVLWVAVVLILTACGSDSKSNAEDIAPGTTALSIVYESTTEKAGKMIGHYHVHAVDDNGKAMSGLKLKMSLINGVKEIRNQKLQRAVGNILSTTPISFHDNGVSFAQTGISVGDALIVLPSSGKTGISYLGDWTIASVGTDLTLKENSYHLETTENLTYIIGNEERLLGGSNGNRGILTVAHIQKQDTNSTFTTDKNGFTYFDVVFDPVLAGHTVTLGVHTSGNRMGTSKVVGLRAAEFMAAEITIPNTGATVTVPMTLQISPKDSGTEHLIDIEVNPRSFKVEPLESCQLNLNRSNFHTDAGGRVILVVETKGTVDTVDKNGTTSTSGAESCTIKWDGGISSLALEY